MAHFAGQAGGEEGGYQENPHGFSVLAWSRIATPAEEF